MLDVHIDDFFKDCAVILLHGFKYFPTKQVLYVEDICGPDEADEFGLHSPRHLAGFGAIIWLQVIFALAKLIVKSPSMILYLLVKPSLAFSPPTAKNRPPVLHRRLNLPACNKTPIYLED
jgi:hypothetical protein